MGAGASAIASALTCDLLPSKNDEPAYCVECADEDTVSPVGRIRKSLRLERRVSNIDDSQAAWATYIASPSAAHQSPGFNSAGVQRIDLPYAPADLNAVANAVTSDGLGLECLGKLHTFNIPERLAAWRAEFAKLDLGDFDEAAQASADSAIGKLFNGLCWSVLLIQPNRFFPVHQHPDVEVEFVLRGAVYENRLLLQPDRMLDTSTLPDPGMPKLYRVARHTGGGYFSNPRYSVHQSYTLDEGAVLLVLWCGRHNNLVDTTRALWDPSRCQNPLCPFSEGHKALEYLK